VKTTAAKATWPPMPAETRPAAPPEPVAEAPVELEVQAAPSVQEFSFDTDDMVVAEPEPALSAPIEPTPAIPAPVEMNFEPVAIDVPPARAIAPPTGEIDISNEWEDMIEVEPEESPAAAIEVQSYQEIIEEQAKPAKVPLEPVASIEPAQPDVSVQTADKVQEIRFYISQEMWEPAKAAILDLTELAPDDPEVTGLIAEVSAGQAKGKSATVEARLVEMEDSPAAFAAIEIEEPSASEALLDRHVIAEEPPAAQPAPALDLENVLDIAEAPKAKPSKSVPAQPAVAAAGQSTEDILGDFLQDLEQSDLADFVPKPTPSTPAPVPAPAPAPTVAAAAPVMDRRSNGDMKDAESANVLSDILSELRDETSEAAEPEEDPETHYNLGIAFKEMGLLDEAIGELQKVCHAVDRGAPFSQPIQALTWLAQCLVDKGAPEAAVRWYQKALQLPGLDSGSRCSIYYDLGAAYQAAGDNKSALTNFMEVYGSNIDFRDVASRIKALKA
ncbi:MAG: hypothetical protein ACXV5R_05550, partial [Candidatus Angelobacter sp.]